MLVTRSHAHPQRHPRSLRERTFAAVIAVLIVAVGLAPGLASAPAAAAATTPITEWTVGPADADAPDGRISLRHVIDPGASASDHIAVTNLGSDETEFQIASGDGVIGPDGAFDIATGDPVDSGLWITVGGLSNGSTLSVPAGETRVLPLTIDVPADAAPGDHPAGIVVGVSSNESGVAVSHRIGVRLHLQVAGDLAPRLELDAVETAFTPSWLPFAPGTLTIEATVVNTGNVRLGAVGAAAAAGPWGLGAVDAAVPAAELLPGDSSRQRFVVEAWPVALLMGDVEVRATALGDDRLTLPATVSSSFSTVAVSWPGAVLIVLVAGAAVLATIVVVRRRRRSLAVADETPDDLAHEDGARERSA